MSPEQLFPRANREFLTLLAGLPKHLDAAMPMRKQHRRQLPSDIRHLSHLLTDERGDLRRDYLADPAALSAYMRYFLPWNLYRLGVLFAGLALDPGGDSPEAGATIIDLGTGPITAPLALWMSRPRLRKRALHFICVDRAPKPMRLGLDTLKHMAEAQGGLAPWRITLVKGPLDARLREKADLVIMANALNEVLHRGEGELMEDAGALAGHLSSMLTPTGSLLVVEPGVRPSAHLIAALRRGLLHRGLNPLSPCPHTNPCPMSGRGYTAWCHFNFDAEVAPGWLKRLSDEAKLAKDNVSLSFLHFSAKGRHLEAGEGKSYLRCVSGPLELPGEGTYPRFGQYCCSDRGLTLLSLPRKHLVPLPGTLLEAAWPAEPEKDAKSGALILPMGQETAPAAPPSPKPTGAATPGKKHADVSADKNAAPQDEEPRQKPARKPARLPSERPMERAKPKEQAKPKVGAKKLSKDEAKRPSRKPEQQAEAESEWTTERKPAPAREPSRPATPRKPTPGGKPQGKPTGKPAGKTVGKTSGKPAGGKKTGAPKKDSNGRADR